MPQSQLTESQFRDSLEKAVDQSANIYSRSFALHARWEDDDDTQAQRDCDNFQIFLATFGFQPPTIHTLEVEYWCPAWRLQVKVRSILEHPPEGRSICFIHYSGQSTVEHNNELYLTPPSGSKTIHAKGLLDSFTSEGMLLPYDSLIDVVIILDCCYSYLAPKAAQPVSRWVEFLAAADANARGAHIPGERVSFSAELAAKVAQLKETGR